MKATPKAIIDYLGGLTVNQGRLAGQPFKVLPWQARFIRGAFRPGVQSAGCSVEGVRQDGVAFGDCVRAS